MILMLLFFAVDDIDVIIFAVDNNDGGMMKLLFWCNNMHGMMMALSLSIL